jgi:PAS domain S-box-containing protein
VLESISDAFYALDRDWSFTYVNARAAEILGRSPDELLGRSIWVEFAPALGTAFEREYRRAMDTGRVVTFEAWYEPLAGWFELRAYPGPDGLSVYFRDITERRAAEAALRETEERLRLAVDSTGLGTWDYVPATDALHWDPRTKLAFGLRGDAEVRDYSAFFARVHPEDRARTQALVDAATDPAGSGEYDTTFRVVLPQAAERWVRARGRALFAGEGAGRYVTRFIGTVLDVTAERAASAERERLLAALAAEQARLTQVFEQAPVAVAVLRGRAVDDLVFELVNPRYEEMIPADRAPLGRRVRDALPEVVDTMGAVLQQVLDAGEPFVAHDYCVPLDRDGDGAPEAYYFNFVYHPLTDADSTVVGIVGVGTEVTDSVRARRDAERLWTAAEGARAEAERARADAEAANRAKGEFLAIMSHELRTPLNAIDGYAELMELGIRGPLTEQQRADLGRIRTSQRHLLGLINGVLNYSRIEAGAVRYAVEAVPVAETLSTCEALTAPQARARELTLGWRGCDATLCARGDQEKVQQIVLNLLSNSVKFTERGGRVELACEARGGDVVITVTDTGRGIPADRLEQVFEPFVQVDASRTRTQEGVGLGLAISRDLARGMGGDLTAESTPGEGSTFTLTLARA